MAAAALCVLLAACDVDECKDNSKHCTGGGSYAVCVFEMVGDHGGHTEWRNEICPSDAPLCRQADGIVTCLPKEARPCSSMPLLPAAHIVVFSATIGDVNGDAYSDVGLVLDYAPLPMLSVAMGSSAGRFDAHLEVAKLQTGERYFPAFGDFNGDGAADLAAAVALKFSKGSELSWWRGDGTGAFTAAGSYQLAGDAMGLVAGDLDGDGKAELVVAETSDPRVTVMGLAGDSLVALAQLKQVTSPLALLGGNRLVAQDSVYEYEAGSLVLVQPLPITGALAEVAVADFDLDGIPDLALAHSQWSQPFETPVEIHSGSSSGEFTRSAILRADRDFTVADVDGTGSPDLVTVTTDARIGFYRNQLAAGFSPLEQRFPRSRTGRPFAARMGPTPNDQTIVMAAGTLRAVGADCFEVP